MVSVFVEVAGPEHLAGVGVVRRKSLQTKLVPGLFDLDVQRENASGGLGGLDMMLPASSMGVKDLVVVPLFHHSEIQ